MGPVARSPGTFVLHISNTTLLPGTLLFLIQSDGNLSSGLTCDFIMFGYSGGSQGVAGGYLKPLPWGLPLQMGRGWAPSLPCPKELEQQRQLRSLHALAWGGGKRGRKSERKTLPPSPALLPALRDPPLLGCRVPRLEQDTGRDRVLWVLY